MPPTMIRRVHGQTAGWWEPAVRPGQQVAEGEALGTVSNIDGGHIQETVPAPFEGVVMFLTTSPAVQEGGLLLGLGAR